MIDLDYLEKLTREATEAPWNEFRFMRGSRVDAFFLEAARDAMPEILSRLRKLEAVREASAMLVGPQNVGKTVDVRLERDGAVSAIFNGSALYKVWNALMACEEP